MVLFKDILRNHSHLGYRPKSKLGQNPQQYSNGALHTVILCAKSHIVKMCTCHCQTPVVLSEIVIMKTKNPISLTTQVRQRIRQLREQNGLTQDKLCEYAGISSDSVTQ